MLENKNLTITPWLMEVQALSYDNKSNKKKTPYWLLRPQKDPTSDNQLLPQSKFLKNKCITLDLSAKTLIFY